MSSEPLSWLTQELHALRSLDLHRVLRRVDGPQETEVTIDGTPCLLLASNNYLGLANDPRLKAGAMRAIERYGTGAGASRLISGHLDIHEELEARLAEFKRTEAVLAFGSGYLANLGVITSLTGPGDTIQSDQLNHASIIDGCRLSGASVRIYRHRD